jgi:type IV pilus assembly protein PilA
VGAEEEDNVAQQEIEARSLARQRGFTLIEILLVIAIIGLLAAIAIPQFIRYRSQAIDAQLKSDLRNAAVAVEGYFSKKTVYPASIAEIDGYGFKASEGVTITLDVLTPTSYTITAAKPGGTQASFTLTSTTGSIN